MKLSFSRSFILSVTLLAACTVGPDYERPPVQTPSAYKESGHWSMANPQDDSDRGAWWSVYKDPILDNLEKQVDLSNQNLKAGEAAYRQTNAIIDETRASLFPTLSLNSSATRSAVSTAMPKNNILVSANASWTPDIWGGIRRNLESDVANAEISAAELASARLSAQGLLATTYFELLIQDQLERLLEENVKAYRGILTIVKNQYAEGVAAQSDVLTAQNQLDAALSAALQAHVNRNQDEHAIAVLIGKTPAEFSLDPAPLVFHIPHTPPGLPSTLLERRPDIAAAERAMAAANAQIGVQTAAWFPNLTLSPSYGYSGALLSKLLQASNSFWSVGPSVAETIFDAGARDARIDQARAAFDQSVATYRQTVLNAFQNVEDNLSAFRIFNEQSTITKAAVADARKNEQIAHNQYKEGIVALTSVLSAQLTRINQEEADLTVDQNRLVASVALIQSLGGGWTTKQMKAR